MVYILCDCGVLESKAATEYSIIVKACDCSVLEPKATTE